ncbi:MAG: LamG-like jellyroll fold domain-containing protein [Kiritimatiellia bacterium]
MKTKYFRPFRLLLVTLLALASGFVFAEKVDVSQYAKTFDMTVSGYSGASELTDFPVLVVLSESRLSGFQYAEASNLVFTDSEGNIIPYEKDTWNKSGESLVWVKMPTLSPGTKISAYFGGTAEAKENNPAEVWSRYASVYHFTELQDTVHGIAVKPGYSANAAKLEQELLGTCYRVTSANEKIVLGLANQYVTQADRQSVTVWFRNTSTSSTGVTGRLIGGKSAYSSPNEGGFDILPQQGKVWVRGAVYVNNVATFKANETPFLKNEWKHVGVVMNQTEASVYVDGTALTSSTGTAIAAPDISKNNICLGNYGGNVTDSDQLIAGDYDEVRFFDGVMTADWAAAEFATVKNWDTFLAYGEVKAPSADTAIVKNVAVANNGNDTYTFTADVEGSGSYTAKLICTPMEGDAREIEATLENGQLSATTPADLAAGTWILKAIVSASSTETVSTSVVITKGGVQIETLSNADEYELQPGTVRVTRPDAAPYAVTIDYQVSSETAVAGQTYAELSGSVTIPAGESYADITIQPLADSAVTEDAVLAIALLSGATYSASETGATTEVVIKNLTTPDGYVTWVATAADAVASDPASWSTGAVPGENDAVLIDGNFSSQRVVWDVAGPQKIKSFTMKSAPPTVEIRTTYEDGAFPQLEVTGDFNVKAGTLTGAMNDGGNRIYRLKLAVGGNLTIDEGATITLTGKGYYSNTFPDGSMTGAHGGTITDWAQSYGNVKEPVDLGAGGKTLNTRGGGACYLTVGGIVTVNGSLLSNASSAGGTDGAQVGAGGSIYIRAKDVQGNGTISVHGHELNGYKNWSGGAGGRLAIVLTEATALSFPKANLNANGLISKYNETGAGGTIFVKTADQENGTLIIGDYLIDQVSYIQFQHTKTAVAAIPPGQTWEFDAIEFRNGGVLCVPEGTTLRVPLSGITGSSRRAGLLYAGGTIDFGAAPYELTGAWTFQADTPFTFDGDVTISSGAAIGALRFAGTFDNFATSDVTVNGNLTVESDGWIYADSAGLSATSSAKILPSHGGQMTGFSGNGSYDSVFDPFLPASASTTTHEKESAGGGVVKLTVNGDFVLNGTATACGPVRYKGAGSGGALNIRAKTLSGDGKITADGTIGSIQWDSAYHGAGGRIAVRVTDQDVGTDGIWTRITARGVPKQDYVNSSGNKVEQDQDCSAGTVYLQGESDGEGGGTIYVSSAGRTKTIEDVPTYIPSGNTYGKTDDYSKASLVVGTYGTVRLDQDGLKMKALSLVDDGRLDLAGNKLVVTFAEVDSQKVSSGLYQAGDLAEALLDSSEGQTGVLCVTGTGTAILVR